jgi:glycosyltransferase involved in cell wall biosynthesis
MPEVYAQAHMVVLPSYREGLPKSLLEAGAMQRPVIATDAQGCRDVVYNEQSGILVPPRDAAALARAILRLAGDPELRESMGRAGRARVLREFSDDVIIRQTLELYGRALPGFGHAPHPMAG